MRKSAALALVALVLATTVGWLTAPAASAQITTGDVTLTVDDVQPNTPSLSSKPRPLTITLTVANQTAATLTNIVLTGTRSDPVATQSALDDAVRKPHPPTPAISPPPLPPMTVDLGGYESQTVVVHTTTATTQNPVQPGICLCHNAVYPIYFTATYVQAGVPIQLATAQTYIPSFDKAPTKEKVTWLWPLLDRPHRLARDNVFVDDELANEVRPGGRLDHLLSVIENVAPTVSMTIVTDPELIDELAVMGEGYRVYTPDGLVAGTGGPDALAWLARLRLMLTVHKSLELAFTPYADPAVDSLNRAGLSWSLASDPDQTARVTAALGGAVPQHDITWPVGEALHPDTLSTLVSTGSSTVVLGDTALTSGPPADDSAVPDALAPLQTDSGTATAAVTSTPIEKLVRRVLVTPDGAGLGAVPQLAAELAIRAVVDSADSHYIVITPPRRMTDVDPDVATRAILATAATPWSSSIGLRAAVAQIEPVDHGELRAYPHTPGLSHRTLATLRRTTTTLTKVSDVFADPAVAVARLKGLRPAIQRCESSSLLGPGGAAAGCVRTVQHKISRVRNGVSLVRPSGGKNYTLSSTDADLPVTIRNRLNARVQVHVMMSSPSGFSADPVDATIAPGATVQLRIATHVSHVGVFKPIVSLRTQDGQLRLGHPIKLHVRSTALGTIGVVITIAAGAVLALALLFRFARRMRKGPPVEAPDGSTPDGSTPDDARTGDPTPGDPAPAAPSPTAAP